VSNLAADRLAGLILEIDIRKRLSAMIAHDKTCGLLLDGPGRREAAGRHYPPLAERALARNGESVVSFPRFITEFLTFPPRLTRAAGQLVVFRELPANECTRLPSRDDRTAFGDLVPLPALMR
jgi:hypothetical protein